MSSRSDLIKLLNQIDKEIAEISFFLSTAIKVYDNYITVKLKSREENYVIVVDFLMLAYWFDVNFLDWRVGIKDFLGRISFKF